MMSTPYQRVITREEADDWGLPYEPENELERSTEDTLRWSTVHRLVFRAPDDYRTYGVTYQRAATEQQEQDPWDGASSITLTAFEQRPVMQWVPVERADDV